MKIRQMGTELIYTQRREDKTQVKGVFFFRDFVNATEMGITAIS